MGYSRLFDVGYTDIGVLVNDLVASLTRNTEEDFAIQFEDPVGGYVSVQNDGPGTYTVVLEPTSTVNSLTTQPWRIRFEVLNADQLKVFVGTPLQLPSTGEVYMTLDGYHSGELGGKFTQTQYGREDVKTLIKPTIIGDQRDPIMFIDRSIYSGDIAPSYPMSSRLVVSDRGISIAVWIEGNDEELIVDQSWLVVQRPVHQDTGVPLVGNTSKNPVFCLFGITHAETALRKAVYGDGHVFDTSMTTAVDWIPTKVYAKGDVIRTVWPKTGASHRVNTYMSMHDKNLGNNPDVENITGASLIYGKRGFDAIKISEYSEKNIWEGTLDHVGVYSSTAIRYLPTTGACTVSWDRLVKLLTVEVNIGTTTVRNVVEAINRLIDPIWTNTLSLPQSPGAGGAGYGVDSNGEQNIPLYAQLAEGTEWNTLIDELYPRTYLVGNHALFEGKVRHWSRFSYDRIFFPPSGAPTNDGPVLAIGDTFVVATGPHEGYIGQFTVRERDIHRPTPQVSATSHCEDHGAILNPQNQISRLEVRPGDPVYGEGKYVIIFPNRLNTQRFRYTNELDMVAYTSADVIGAGLASETIVYGEQTARRYVGLQASTKYNTGVRVLLLWSGGSVIPV